MRPAATALDPGWIERNIVSARVPILGDVVCHRLVVPQLRNFMFRTNTAEIFDPVTDAWTHTGTVAEARR